MPTLGEIKKDSEIGYKGSFKRIYHACEKCGKERWVVVRDGKAKCKLCSTCAKSDPNRRLKVGKKGDKHWKWNGGKSIIDGYIQVKIDPDDFFYQMAKQKQNYILEHRLVMAKHLGRCLQSWEIVHHKNGIKDDNRLENLELTTAGSHVLEHNKGYGDGYRKGFTDGQTSQIKELRKELKLIQWQNSQLLEELRKIKSEA
uniref:Putative homing endonuclease n=1 Tax=viral metagenome TaxID=1070528 RepID=A0A6M3IXZ3_9ZZZZ